ncbi:RNA ligase (TIGR02306 family) [Chitinivorax tropicus]|uniref:RNA ligase (TIGR02306 family) n=1 Tax=Chitinivorax tropicus TaxID=714531 RepID=A0A840MNE4_9PROT|nr:RNA ligase (TIGR02306 family) [Chitinivorax tropicus]
MNARKLVTIRRIEAIRPIPGADTIECATVGGWQVVVKKGEFRPGESGVYFEIDAFLPVADDRFAFLAKHQMTWRDKQGVRLHTMNLCGHIFQGLILPIGRFPEIVSRIAGKSVEVVREMDFSTLLGVEKWEAAAPASFSGEVVGPFPSWMRKTELERVQNLLPALHTQADELFEVSVKLNGTNMTVFHRNGELGVCGRDWQLAESQACAPWQVAKALRLTDALTTLGRNIALQGEIVGEGIQGNPEHLCGQRFYVFDVFDIDRGTYLGREQRGMVLDALRQSGAQIEMVPVIGIMDLRRFRGCVESVLDFAEGPSMNPRVAREGVVFKRLDGRFSFKAVANSYLLKHQER